MMTPAWTRPSLKLRRRAAPILVGLACGASFVIGVGFPGAPARPLLVPIVTPVSITVPPAQVVLTPDPPPAPVVEPAEPVAPPRLRAVTPHLMAQCLIPIEGEAQDKTCAWDDGFPAISRDGSVIATRYMADDGGRGYPGESIHWIDVKTGHVVRDALVLSPAEYDPAPETLARLRVTIGRRAQAIQRELDAREFRTLVFLGSARGDEDVTDIDLAKVHAEIAGGLMRIVDPATGTAIAQHEFGVVAPHPARPEGECAGWGLYRLGVWWDPSTKVTLGNSTYRTGGCMCRDVDIEQVARLR
jgi:hypothetical protein